MMAQKKAGPPPGRDIVRDGLVLRLCGFNRGGVPGQWIDEIQGVSYTLTDVKELENGIAFTGRNFSGGISSTNPNIPSYELGTVEACYTQSNPRGTGIVFSPTNNGEIGIGPISSEIIWIFDNKNTKPKYKPQNLSAKQTVSCSLLYGFYNRTKMGTVGKDFYRCDSMHSYIGHGQGNTYSFNGTIHEIRIYNRHLTEAEILQNQQYDIDTYFGGVTP